MPNRQTGERNKKDKNDEAFTIPPGTLATDRAST